MSDNGFHRGRLTYTVASMTPRELAEKTGGSWKDGYVAFAASEKRLAQLPVAMDEEFFSERIRGLADADGYVTEINLWRGNGKTIEEIAAEREDNSFHVQHWLLDTDPAAGTDNCRHREADTKSGSHHDNGRRLFSDGIKSVEIVWPEYRLNFYLTTEGI